MSSFIHLNCHSGFSFMRGTFMPEDLCKFSRERGMGALALTDTNGVYGLIRFLQAAEKSGIKPIIGSEIVTEDERAIILVKKRRGYEVLCELITKRHIQEDFCLSDALVQALGAASSCVTVLSDIPSLLLKIKRGVGDQGLYCELRPSKRQYSLLQWARKEKLPVVATNNVHFANPGDYHTHKLLRAIALNTKLSRLRPEETVPVSCWLKSPLEMKESFPHCAEAIENTLKIAAECPSEWDFSTIVSPQPGGVSESGLFETLRQKCLLGAKKRYREITGEITQRLEYELGIILQTKFAGYFLIVEDFVKKSPLTCGRGSAAASVVSYCLGITHVDPIRHNLFFERFLNPGRKDPPDIDIDFCWDERDEILEYVFTKYGANHAAMIANHVGFQARASIREIAKVYGMPVEEINAITKKLSGFWNGGDPGELIRNHPKFKEIKLKTPWEEILSLAAKIEGLPRNLSVHCGGVVIAPDGLTKHVPFEPAPKGVNIIQWEKDQAEDAGLVKIDILGNRSLAVIRDALQSVKRNYGVDIPYSHFNPLEDLRTQEMIKQGQTMGVFYVESPAMRQLQKKTGEGSFERLVVHSSIIRPAANDYIREYVRRLRGGAYGPLHPMMNDILKETFGIMVFQEDVSRVAMAMAGFGPVEADGLRKAMSKKNRLEKLRDYRQRFFKGAKQKGVSEKVSSEVWDMMMSFSGYSFCKPHSASYAMVSFKSCYLRAHYPAEFMAAVISNGGGFYSPFAYISEARRMGLEVLPPCVNESERKYTGINRTIRVGLMQLKGLTSGGCEKILKERKRRPFKSFEDFLSRTDIHPNDSRTLIKAGCFDGIEKEKPRPELMWRLFARQERKKNHTLPMFEESEPEPQALEEYDNRTILCHELETLGFILSCHPLDLYERELSRVKHIKAMDLDKFTGRFVTLAGWLITGKTVHTKNGDPMEFISFEDETAIYETTFFPRAYQKFCHMLTTTKPFILKGKVEADFGAVSVNVSWVGVLGDR